MAKIETDVKWTPGRTSVVPAPWEAGLGRLLDRFEAQVLANTDGPAHFGKGFPADVDKSRQAIIDHVASLVGVARKEVENG